MKNRLIYILEDERLLREAYKRLIYKNFKFIEIKEFVNYKILIREIKKKSPDIIISDLIRGDSTSPIECIKRINAEIDKEKTKIIISSWSLLRFIGEIYDYCDEFLLKPFPPEKLLKKIECIFSNKNINNNSGFIFEEMLKINDTIDSINFNFYTRYNINTLIKSHWRNNIDIFDLPKSKMEVVSYLSILSSFFDRFNISKNNLLNQDINGGTLNLMENFFKENNINISIIWLREIKKLRNSYPNHLENKELFEIYKNWGITDLLNYNDIATIALKKLIIFLEELKNLK